MEITLFSQTTFFLLSILLGAILSLLFDGIRVANAVLKDNLKRVFFEDIFYFILSAVVTFIYILIVNMGEIRVYIIVGEIIGWVLYRFTLGNFIFKIVLIIVNFIMKWINIIKEYLVSKIPKDRFEKLKKKINGFYTRFKNKFKVKFKGQFRSKKKMNKKTKNLNVKLNKKYIEKL